MKIKNIKWLELANIIISIDLYILFIGDFIINLNSYV
jgi:hypothetical protein